MPLIDSIFLGFSVALTPENLLYCFLGVLLGTFVGVIPGIGHMTAMSLLFPLTFYLDPTSALIMLAGIWYGTSYGGSTASILLNIPGTPQNAIACLDGHPMANQGRGGVALLMTTVASFIGGSIGIILLMVSAPTIARFALNFGSAEYFSLMILGLIAASAISEGSAVKAFAMVVLGVVLGTVGTDIYSGTRRLTFGVSDLADGVSLVAIAMGIFGVSEILVSIGSKSEKKFDRSSVSFASMKPSRDDLKRSLFPILRGAGIGSFFGTLPGTGPAIAAFVSYSIEKRVSKRPKQFGHGAIEGLAGPESANNSADQTSFIPTLALGIPGSATMALMLGALMIHGIAPGPSLINDRPEVVWGLIMSFWIGNVLLVVLNIPLIGVWVRMLTVPYNVLFPIVLAFICIGVFVVRNSVFDVYMVVLLGIVGYLMRIMRFPAAPLLLGFVLGPMIEEHFRRAMLLSRGDLATFIERPISAIFICLSAAMLIWGIYSAMAAKRIEGAESS